jgi:hypothetical protein
MFTLCTAAGFAEDAYLTKSEFDAFVQQYKANSAWSKGKFTITPYGYINLDASYETDKTTNGDYTVWANPATGKKDPGFSVDPKATRLGLKIEGPGTIGWRNSKTEGVVEIDFQGAYYASRNRSALMLRKAYVAVSDRNTRLLFGQDWEVISPLYPKTLNYTAGAAAGNVGYRRGMIRADHRVDLCTGNDLILQFALADTVYRDGASVSPASARYPMLQGRIAHSFGKNCLPHGKPIVFGVSSHIGEERFTFAKVGSIEQNTKYLKTWSFNVDFDLPITEKLTFQMEYFLGENLSTIEGGLLQGVDLFRRNTIRSQGGWLALSYQMSKKWQSNVGYMIDDPFNKDVVMGSPTAAPAASDTVNSRTYDHCLFTNVMYNWNESLMTGFEVDFWRTHWQKSNYLGSITALPASTSTRYQFTVRYTF